MILALCPLFHVKICHYSLSQVGPVIIFVVVLLAFADASYTTAARKRTWEFPSGSRARQQWMLEGGLNGGGGREGAVDRRQGPIIA